jgi:hypothetical protein
MHIVPRWRGKHFNENEFSIAGGQKVEYRTYKSATQQKMIRIIKAGNIIIIDKIKESLNIVEIASSLRSSQKK